MVRITEEEREYFLLALKKLGNRKRQYHANISIYFGPTLIYKTACELGFAKEFWSEQPTNRILNFLAREGLVDEIHICYGNKNGYGWRLHQNI